MKPKLANNDEGVSAAIGVILMVAITVIMAAVIAAVVFGMAGSTKGAYIVGVTAQRINSDHVTVTYNGGSDARHVTALHITAPSGAADFPAGSTTVGTTVTIPCNYPTTVAVTATFNDGSTAVVMASSL